MPRERRPGPHSEPPDDITERDLPLRSFVTLWFRIHETKYNPLYFGRSSANRFDAPNGEYGVLYVGEDYLCAFIETFGDETGGEKIIQLEDLRARGLVEIEIKKQKELCLVDLTSEGLAHVGADGRLTSGDFDVAQRWSLAFYNHPQQPDGIYYRARHDPGRMSAAIFDRARNRISATCKGSLTSPSLRDVLQTMLATYKFALR